MKRRTMAEALDEVLKDKDIEAFWSGEHYGRGWVTVSDVGCSLTQGAVFVPRRRRSTYHYAELLHEIAHLEWWRWRGQSPTRASELNVIKLSLAIAEHYGFGAGVIEHLNDDLGREAEK